MVISPNPQGVWKPNLTGYWFMTCDQYSKNHITRRKILFSFMNFFRPGNVPLTLHRATIRLVSLMRKKESSILKFLNLYDALREILGSI